MMKRALLIVLLLMGSTVAQTPAGPPIFKSLRTPFLEPFTTAPTGGVLAAGTKYYYRVSAIDAAGTVLLSPEAVLATGPKTSTNTITLNWTAIEGAKQYEVYGRKAGEEGLLATLPANTLTFTDTGRATPSGAVPNPNSVDHVTPRRGYKTT
jgi:hypothetical protein